ncbi:MAG: hypothetical protein WCF79_18945, partial [Rhodomicrobium sp.]
MNYSTGFRVTIHDKASPFRPHGGGDPSARLAALFRRRAYRLLTTSPSGLFSTLSPRASAISA